MSLKQKIQNLLPHPEKLKQDRFLKLLGNLMHDPHLWHINRRSVTGAVAIGFSCAWFVPPFQMLAAAVFAIYFRKNVALSAIATWITNPITYAPMMYAAYWFGGFVINVDTISVTQFIDAFNLIISMSFMDGVNHLVQDFGLPLLVGCSLFAVISAMIGYFGMELFWRYHVLKKLKERKKRQLKLNNN